MNTAHLETLENRTRYRPRDVVEGVAGWELEAPPASAEVRLFWHTSGKGDQDVVVVATHAFKNMQATDAQIYQLRIPDVGPYGFSGKLITLQWSVELVVEPGHHVQRIDLSVSATGEEVRL